MVIFCILCSEKIKQSKISEKNENEMDDDTQSSALLCNEEIVNINAGN